MKKISVFALLVALAACKPNSKKEVSESPVVEEMKVEKVTYPATLQKAFTHHGTVKAWKEFRTLSYEIHKADVVETHTIDLWNRKDRVDTDKYSMGFDGKNVWLLDADKNYDGDAVFYHNLMFYFYAMPFVLADAGIVYSETDYLPFERKKYPGVRIAYESGVGTSPKDEYFMHIDPGTGQMAWLGYTVTYRTGEISDNVKWIRYNDWRIIDGLILPKSITWHNYEGREILDARSTVTFENISLSKTAKPDSFYSQPETAVEVAPKTYD